ncbi:MAG TPA: MerR family transcriptional regulator [Ktedonobacterales bacterium]|nr:MerR family transcriptional regulator [Ktedonobacterales bacterium]
MFTIQDIAARTGLSLHTLRYYERIGLVSPVGRATSGHRRYTIGDLNWLTFLQCLRATGMSIRQMRAFADLRRQGDTMIADRLAFLRAHRQHVLEHLRELEGNLAVIEQKIQSHSDLLDYSPPSSHIAVTAQAKEAGSMSPS